MADMTPQDWVDYFTRQGMTQGLGLNDQGQASFAGPVAGYAGPTRPSDAPYSNADLGLPEKVVPVTYGAMTPQGAPSYSPDTVQQVRQFSAGDFQQQNPVLAKALDALGMMPKGTDKNVQAAIVNKAVPGLVQPATPKVSLQDRALAELGRRRAGAAPGVADPSLAGLNEDELKTVAGLTPKPKGASDVPPIPNANVEKFLTNTYNSVYASTPGNAKQKDAAATAAVKAEAERRNYDISKGGIFSTTISPVARSMPQPGARVRVIGPNGVRGTIPASQLAEALKNGFKQVK